MVLIRRLKRDCRLSPQ